MMGSRDDKQTAKFSDLLTVFNLVGVLQFEFHR